MYKIGDRVWSDGVSAATITDIIDNNGHPLYVCTYDEGGYDGLCEFEIEPCTDERPIQVEVIPSCISEYREIQYIESTIRAYRKKQMTSSMRVIQDNADGIILHYYR